MLLINLKKKIQHLTLPNFLTPIFVNVNGSLRHVKDVTVREGKVVFTLQEMAEEG